ncbi:wHTH domain-containing protein [Phytohabitans houttuyneae]
MRADLSTRSGWLDPRQLVPRMHVLQAAYHLGIAPEEVHERLTVLGYGQIEEDGRLPRLRPGPHQPAQPFR